MKFIIMKLMKNMWLSEVIKELAIVTELIGKYPNQKEKIL